MAHGSAFTLLLDAPAKELGSVDVATNAISVNLETTDILDAMERSATKEAASSPAGALVKKVLETKEQVEDAANSDRPPEAAKLQDEETAARDETKQAEETEKLDRTKQKKARQSAALGGAGTTGADAAPQSEGRVSASQGSILTYGASLRALISSHTPRNIRKAAIRLAFSVAPAGGLSTVSVLATSGRQDVDKRMVELVRSLSPKFPPPPIGASETQLTFNIEVVFR